MNERLVDYLCSGDLVGREFVSEETGENYVVNGITSDRRGYTFIEHKDGTRRNLGRSLKDRIKSKATQQNKSGGTKE